MQKGFTLIELLVVVLIIGVLAAVALPQYEKAVLKSRVTQGLVSLNALEKAQQEIKLATGSYTLDLEALSIDSRGKIVCGTGGAWCQGVVTPKLFVEWGWDWKVEEEKRRCLACGGDKTAEAVCASFGGRKFRTGSSCNYYTMP